MTNAGLIRLYYIAITRPVNWKGSNRIAMSFRIPAQWRYSKTLILIAAAAMLLGACQQNEPAVQAVDVTAMVEQGRIDQALETVSQALSENPRNAGLLYNFALLLNLKGDYEEAQRNAAKALNYEPNDHDLLQLLAEISLNQGGARQALDYLNRMAPDDRNQPRTQYLTAVLHLRDNQLQQAEGALRNTIALGDASPLVKATLAYVKIMQGDADQGKAYLAEAEASTARSDEAVRQIAECYLELGDPQKALDLANTLKPEERRDAQLWTLIGRAQLALLHYGESESAFTRALVCPNSTPWHRVYYARMLFAAQREDEALAQAQSAEEALARNEDAMRGPELYNLLATLYARKGQFLRAHKYLTLSLNLDGQQPKVYELLERLREGPKAGEPTPASADETAQPAAGDAAEAALPLATP